MIVIIIIIIIIIVLALISVIGYRTCIDGDCDDHCR
jgi:hypothetical protein